MIQSIHIAPKIRRDQLVKMPEISENLIYFMSTRPVLLEAYLSIRLVLIMVTVVPHRYLRAQALQLVVQQSAPACINPLGSLIEDLRGIVPSSGNT